MSVFATVVASLAAVLAAAAAPAPTAVAPFAALDTSVPDGSRVVQCVLGEHTVRLVLPDRYRERRDGYVGDGACTWYTGTNGRVSVSTGPTASLASYRLQEVQPYVGYEGDDGISDDVGYDATVPLFGGVAGERLVYRPFNDGNPIEVSLLQAAGVLVDWETSTGVDRTDDLDRVVVSLAVD